MSDGYLERLAKELLWRKSKKVKTLGGVDTKDLDAMNEHLRHMISVNRKLLSAIEEIANESSPFDGSGEPLGVRIAKDLTRRIEIAKAAL